MASKTSTISKMKRMLNKLRGTSDRADRKSAEPKDLADLLSQATITVTYEAIPDGRIRPTGLPPSGGGAIFGPIHRALGDPSVASLPNRSNDVCSVCLDLDPTVDPVQMDFETDIWLAGMHESHPTRTVAATRKELEESAKGCNKCVLLCTGIQWLRPGFFKSDELIQIHISGGLPLRLTIHNPIGPGQAGKERATQGLERLFFEAADWVYDDRIRRMGPPVEDLEFYYPIFDPSIPREHPDHPGNRRLKYLGYGFGRFQDSSQPEVFEAIHLLLRECLEKHPKCRQALQSPSPLPDRVLDLGDKPTSPIRLIETKGEQKARYIALSYCWGTNQSFTTTTATLATRKAGIPLDSLPLLLRDVAAVARKLAIRYLWVDAFCILQDSRADWVVQSAKMGSVYSGAYLTLAAGNAASVHEPLLGPRPRKFEGRSFDIPGIGWVNCRRPTFPYRNVAGEVGPISTRGWTLQERLLSTRLLTFTESAFKVECLTNSKTECQLILAEGLTQLGPPRENYRLDWETVVHWYTGRRLTKATDRLPAISALAKRLHDYTGWRYAAGLWIETLPQGLCWSVAGAGPANIQPDYVAPSWSWASVDGQVTYRGSFNAEETTNKIRWEAQVHEAAVMVEQGGSDFGSVQQGSFLGLIGLFVPCTLDAPPMSGPGSGDSPLVCQLRRIRSPNLTAELRPDTRLCSFGKTRVQGVTRKTVSRWTRQISDEGLERLSSRGIQGGMVWLLRLGIITGGRGDSKCMALVLGNTLRREDLSETWAHTDVLERLGLVDDLPLEFFDGAENVLVSLV